jgi:hypothetical protein
MKYVIFFLFPTFLLSQNEIILGSNFGTSKMYFISPNHDLLKNNKFNSLYSFDFKFKTTIFKKHEILIGLKYSNLKFNFGIEEENDLYLNSNLLFKTMSFTFEKTLLKKSISDKQSFKSNFGIFSGFVFDSYTVADGMYFSIINITKPDGTTYKETISNETYINNKNDEFINKFHYGLSWSMDYQFLLSEKIAISFPISYFINFRDLINFKNSIFSSYQTLQLGISLKKIF